MEENSSQMTENLEPGNFIVTDEINNTDSLGKILKQARESKSFSIEMISRHTKINTSTLHAIENEDIDSLPNIAYLRGFIKSYAKIVNVDEELALYELKKLYEPNFVLPIETQKVIEEQEPEIIAPMKPVIESATVTSNPQNSPPEKSGHQNLLVKVIAGISVIGIAVFIFLSKNSDKPEVTQPQQIVTRVQVTEDTPLKVQKVDNTKKLVEESITPEPEKMVNEKTTEISKPIVTKEEPVKVENTVETKTEKKEESPVVEKQIQASTTKEEIKEEVVEVKIEENKKINEIKLRKEVNFYNIPLPMFTESSNKKALDEFVPKQFQNSVISGKQNVYIKAANGDTWITYKTDKERIKKFVLSEGKQIMMRGDEIKVFLGNVNAAKIFLNNNLLTVTSRSGVKSLVFPKELAKKTKLPLFVFKDDGSVITSSEYLDQLSE